MPAVTVTLPNDGETADAADVSAPILAILAVLNGGLDDANIASVSGSKVTANTLPATAFDTTAKQGWFAASPTPTVSTGYNKGAKFYDLTFAGIDMTSIIAPGMKMKFVRSVAVPTQCATFVGASSQYANKTSPSGITFTNNVTAEAWVKLNSYGPSSAGGCVIGRLDAAGNNGWGFYVTSIGNVLIFGKNAGAANSWTVFSNARVPLGRWVHIAASLDMSGRTTATNHVWINGEDVSVNLQTGGTNPTSLVQGTDLAIGRTGSFVGDYIDGEVQDVRLWNAVRTTTQIQDNMNQQLTGSETNLIGYWKLAGNFNDSNANANNLTAQVGATAATNDSAMNTNEYAEVQSASFSTNTTVRVKAAPGCNVPNLTFSSVYWSSLQFPIGFPLTYDRGIAFYVPVSTNFTTTSASYVDLTNGSFSYTSGNQAEELELELSVMFSSGANTNAQLTLNINGIDLQPALYFGGTVPTRITRRFLHWVPANTTVTIKIRALVSGAVTLTVNTNDQNFVPSIIGRARVTP